MTSGCAAYPRVNEVATCSDSQTRDTKLNDIITDLTIESFYAPTETSDFTEASKSMWWPSNQASLVSGL